jgi:hypothetical protein
MTFRANAQAYNATGWRPRGFDTAANLVGEATAYLVLDNEVRPRDVLAWRRPLAAHLCEPHLLQRQVSNQGQMGHGDAIASLTLGTYSHAIPAMREEAAERIAGLVETRRSLANSGDGRRHSHRSRRPHYRGKWAADRSPVRRRLPVQPALSRD